MQKVQHEPSSAALMKTILSYPIVPHATRPSAEAEKQHSPSLTTSLSNSVETLDSRGSTRPTANVSNVSVSFVYDCYRKQIMDSCAQPQRYRN